MTKYEICEKFGEIMGLSIKDIEANAEGNDPNASVQRPYDCHLSTKALRDLWISHTLIPVREELSPRLLAKCTDFSSPPTLEIAC